MSSLIPHDWSPHSSLIALTRACKECMEGDVGATLSKLMDPALRSCFGYIVSELKRHKQNMDQEQQAVANAFPNPFHLAFKGDRGGFFEFQDKADQLIDVLTVATLPRLRALVEILVSGVSKKISPSVMGSRTSSLGPVQTQQGDRTNEDAYLTIGDIVEDVDLLNNKSELDILDNVMAAASKDEVVELLSLKKDHLEHYIKELQLMPDSPTLPNICCDDKTLDVLMALLVNDKSGFAGKKWVSALCAAIGEAIDNRFDGEKQEKKQYMGTYIAALRQTEHTHGNERMPPLCVSKTVWSILMKAGIVTNAQQTQSLDRVKIQPMWEMVTAAFPLAESGSEALLSSGEESKVAEDDGSSQSVNSSRTLSSHEARDILGRRDILSRQDSGQGSELSV